ncbi:MAG TPA: hypothetical protein VGN72_02660 [Tepidisphaeraceae bacterium]|jgi:hypothetical protein|nr:hypothetical protein [Tepidisphaeraceae bacterium]
MTPRLLAAGPRRFTMGDMPFTDEELKKALKAFKKRLKLTRLDDESKLGHSPLTGGGAKVVAIQPPSGFGREIWEELATQGYLKHDGGGFYELMPGK